MAIAALLFFLSASRKRLTETGRVAEVNTFATRKVTGGNTERGKIIGGSSWFRTTRI